MYSNYSVVCSSIEDLNWYENIVLIHKSIFDLI